MVIQLSFQCEIWFQHLSVILWTPDNKNKEFRNFQLIQKKLIIDLSIKLVLL